MYVSSQPQSASSAASNNPYNVQTSKNSTTTTHGTTGSSSPPPLSLSSSAHDELCRTISDTLGAEFSEYVTRIKTTPYGQQQLILQHQSSLGQDGPTTTSTSAPASATTALDEVIGDCNYTARVEFGLKLGYTEAQVQIALVKLGPLAGQNELLAELIKLGAANNGSGNSGCEKSSCSSALGDYHSVSGGGHQTDASDESNCEYYHAAPSDGGGSDLGNLKPIVIDGSNVAMSHGNKELFSCMGIKICVDWFKARGHREITVFVPMWRKEVSRPDAPIKDRDILLQLEQERLLVFTPSRNVGGRRMVCYDDRYILKLAVESDGIVVSNDNYRDLVNENPEYKKLVEDRLLMYSFVNDRFMPPDDPCGRKGPSLDNFLRRKTRASEAASSPPCPYGKKCTYGNKCKYYHPERGNQPQKSVTEQLVEQAKIQLREVKARNNVSAATAAAAAGMSKTATASRESSPGEKMKATHTGSLPPSLHVSELTRAMKKTSLSRTKSVTPGQSLGGLSVASGSSAAEPSALDCFWNLNPMMMSGVHQAQHPQLFSSSNSQSCADLYGDRMSGKDGRFFGNQSENQDSAARQNFTGVDDHGSSGNLHRKLQRQLTLNPTYDPRLRQMSGYQENRNSQQQVQRPQHQQPVGSHRYLNRMGSEPHIQTQQQFLTTCYNNANSAGVQQGQQQNLHQNVTRIASAPDSTHVNWPGSSSPSQSNIARQLNQSFSDTRLHLNPSPPLGLDSGGLLSGSLSSAPLAPFPGQVTSIWSNNDNLYGSGSSSAQQQPSSPHWSQPGAAGPVRPSSVPPKAHMQQHHSHQHGMGMPGHHQQQMPLIVPQARRPSASGLSLVASSSSPRDQLHSNQRLPSESPSDMVVSEREKLYFHLSSIFSEDQVRAAMEMYPDETKAQKICGAILAMFPKGLTP